MPRPRSLPQIPETEFAIWLREELTRRKSNQNKMAVASGIARATVNAWFTLARVPSPELCTPIANYLRIPVEEVLIRAGHLSADHQYEQPAIPGWLAAALEGLTDSELRVVAATARGLREVRPDPEEDSPAQ